MKEIWEKHNDEYCKFENVIIKLSSRPDIHAFIKLNELFPGDRDIICASHHDEYFLDIEGEQINQICESDIIDLIRCGVMYSEEYDCLSMFS